MIVVALVILLSVVAYIANYKVAVDSIQKKEHLIHLLRKNMSSEPSEWDVPEEYLCLRFDDEGNVTGQRNMEILAHTNIHKTPLKDTFEKLRGRALTGGGFTKFRWVDPKTQVLREYMFSSARIGTSTMCIASLV